MKRRLIIENDDRIFNIRDVYGIGTQLNIPVVFDNLHHEANPCDGERDEFIWIERCRSTWREQDGPQKIHYSQQAKQKKKGYHSDTIDIERFMAFYEALDREDIDIMLEVKDKNLSCVKCIHCTTEDLSFDALQMEWDRYKYSILERSPVVYAELTEMIGKRDGLTPVTFYKLIQQGLENMGDIESHTEAMLLVWECINREASEKEWQAFHKRLERYRQQKASPGTVKSFLKKLAEKYAMDHLLHSYYFFL
ncbi:MAG TPA: DUF1722 domain-containing protein [Thermoclostridium caenicola]|nr:DUF1722 domain-containing protein [Thermoclostridium caenicola]HOP71636.1 DUF1722 domain-containing protein [Thermoclostridium caenicola]